MAFTPCGVLATIRPALVAAPLIRDTFFHVSRAAITCDVFPTRFPARRAVVRVVSFALRRLSHLVTQWKVTDGHPPDGPLWSDRLSRGESQQGVLK
jgi:hypothetical protein